MIMFENRNFGGATYEVAIYSDDLYRMDEEGDNRPYASAPYKYFTTTEMEAKNGYERQYQLLRHWRPNRPLVLLHLFNADTRAAFRELLTEQEQANLNFAFPVKNAVVSRVSEADSTQRDYRIADAVCREHGLDGYFVGASPTLHSEIMLCHHTLQEGVLMLQSQKRIGPPVVKRKRAQVEAENAEMGFQMPQLPLQRPLQPPRTPPRAAVAAAAADAANLFGARGYQTPPRAAAAAAQGYQTPRRNRRRNRRRTRRTRRAKRTRRIN